MCKLFSIICVLLTNKLALSETSLDILPNDYYREAPPKLNGNPVDVNVSIIILALNPESDSKMAFNIDIFYHLYWTDHRLKALNGSSDKLTLDSNWKNRLWIPDTYFRNAISGGIAEDVVSPSLYFTVTNTTNLFMASRIRMKLSCDMKFNKYPFDKQICFINITTLSQSIDSVVLNWQSFRVGRHVDLPEFEITDEYKGVCTKDFKNLGIYSCLYVVIHMNRNFGNYLIKRFVPSFLIVIMSFIGFWIPTQIAPARISLIITSLLALIAQQIQAELNVSYVYALEVWTIICITFVFSTLIEYAIAISWPFQPIEDNIENSVSCDANDEKDKKRRNRWFIIKCGPKNCSVDMVSRLVFPTSFLMSLITFSFVYYFME